MKVKKIVNLTPHAVNIITAEGSIVTIESEGVARCATIRKVIGEIEINGIAFPQTTTTFGAVEGLPEPQEGTAYVVSGLVAAACPERQDLCVPDDLIRDEAGMVKGCKGLSFPNIK